MAQSYCLPFSIILQEEQTFFCPLTLKRKMLASPEKRTETAMVTCSLFIFIYVQEQKCLRFFGTKR